MKSKTHKKSEQPWRGNYYSARDRCLNKNCKDYHRYGGRGIMFDIGFWEMGVLYWMFNADKMKNPTIDRIDPNGNYCFKNCRFVEREKNSSGGMSGKTPWNKGKKFSEKEKERLYKHMYGSKNWLGRKHTEETKKKMSESAKNRNKKSLSL